METAAEKINALAERMGLDKRVRNGFESGADVVELLDHVVTRVERLEQAVTKIGMAMPSVALPPMAAVGTAVPLKP